MTRFARAKGSKASNERHPEEPTPWHVMKQDMETASEMKNDNLQQKSKSAKELLNEKDDPYYATTVDNVKTDWAEIKNDEVEREKMEKSGSTLEIKVKQKKKSKIHTNEVKEDNENEVPAESVDDSTSNKKSYKRKTSDTASVEEGDNKLNVVDEAVESSNLINKDKKRRKKKSSEPLETPKADNCNIEKNVEIEESNSMEDGQKTSKKLSKRQKRNRKNKLKSQDGNTAVEDKAENEPSTFNTDGNEWNDNINFGNSKPVKLRDELSNQQNESENDFENKNHPNNQRASKFNKPNNQFNNNTQGKKRKPAKIRDDKDHKRRKPAPGVTKVMINGMEVEIVMYDGFPVKKDDAERMKDLRKQMVMKGISKKEIDIAMKLERRRAEKALARIKKNVCFHCRKAGHNLSDCPELGKEEVATGICFKCGSTEHTHFECKVNKKSEFRFATCFICREQGHIAKQCPDNPKGLYPNGGSCNICGDVTHLKKDCPEFVTSKEENTLTVGTIAETAIESLDDEDKMKKSNDNKKTTNKIVKF